MRSVELTNISHDTHVFIAKLNREIVTYWKIYCPTRPHAGLENVLMNGTACHMLVPVCLPGSNLNVHNNPEKLMVSRDATGI